MSEDRNKRKIGNLLINPTYQLQFLLAFAGLGIILIGINLWIFYVYGLSHVGDMLELAAIPEGFRRQLYSEFQHVFLMTAMAMLLAVVVLCAFSITFSHRTAGALRRFQLVFEQIRDGDRDARIQLRSGDHFHDVARSFNEMMDRISTNLPK